MQTYLTIVLSASVTLWLAFLVAGRIVCHRESGALSRLRAVMLLLLPVAGLTVAWMLWEPSADVVEPLAAAVGLEAHVWLLAQLPAGLGVVIVTTSAYLGLFPYVREARDVEIGWASTARRFARYAAGIAAFVAAVADLFLAASGPLPTWGAVLVTGVAFVAVGYAVSPALIAVTQRLRRPDDGEAARIREHCDAVGLDVDRVRIIDTPDESAAQMIVRGPPGRRHLYLTDAMLRHPDDEFRATLAVVRGLRQRRWTLLRIGALVGCAGVLAYGLLADDPAALFGAIVLTGASYLGLAALCRRQMLAADRAAADRAGSETLESAFLRQMAINDSELRYGRVGRYLGAAPSSGRRIAALRGRDDHPAEAAEFPTPAELPEIGEDPQGEVATSGDAEVDRPPVERVGPERWN